MEFSLAFFLWFRACRPVRDLPRFHAPHRHPDHDQHPLLRRADVDRLSRLPHAARVRIASSTPSTSAASSARRAPSSSPQVEAEPEAEIEVSEFHEAAPSFRPSSVIVRFDAGERLRRGPIAIDRGGQPSASRPVASLEHRLIFRPDRASSMLRIADPSPAPCQEFQGRCAIPSVSRSPRRATAGR